jgi:hypothetical protein
MLSVCRQRDVNTGRRSADTSLLPNTTVLYYGRVLSSGVRSTVEWSYVDYIERNVLAGFVSSNDAGSYARIGIDHQSIAFSVSNDAIPGSEARIPGLFTMLGGPAFGPSALVRIIKHYGWERAVLYFQNAPGEVILSETFVSMARLEGIKLDLQKRESAVSAAEDDFADLVAATSNVFLFFGGHAWPVRQATLCRRLTCRHLWLR